MTIKNNPADDVISIIVPCFNEESVLPAFYSAVSDAASSIEGAVCEFLFIDDGSKDGSLNLIKDICSKKENYFFLKFKKNYGLSAALKAGFDYAESEFTGYIDADLQVAPEDFSMSASETSSTSAFHWTLLPYNPRNRLGV